MNNAPSLRELVDLYLLRCEVEGKSPRTVVAYRGTLKRFLGAVDIEHAADVSQEHVYAYLGGCCGLTGARCSEVVQLELSAVDLEEGRIRILHGKGNKQRVVPFAGACRATLAAYLEVRGSTPGALFVTSNGSKQELIEGLAIAIHSRSIRFPDGQLAAELAAFQYEVTPTGERYGAPPGVHADCVIALALAV